MNLFGADVKNAARNCLANAGTCGSGDNLKYVGRDFLKKVKCFFTNKTKEVNDLLSLELLSFLSQVSETIV